MDKLKPCPFCGEIPNVEIIYPTSGVSFLNEINLRKPISRVGCRNCGIDISYNPAFWNTRPAEDAKDKEIEKLKSDLGIQKNLTNQACFEAKRAYAETDKWKKMFYDLIDKQSNVATNPKVIVVMDKNGIADAATKESEGENE